MALTKPDGSIRIATYVDTKGIKQGANTINKQMTSITGNVNAAFSKIGKMMVAFVAAGTLLKFGKQAVETASDLQEVQNVVDTAFGSMSYKMEEFAKTAIDTFGISQLAAKKTGSTFMAMASGMGIASDVASDMAVSLTGLSADMSSFYNVSQDLTSIALKSIFTGETETLKQYGIVMTEVNLKQYALSKGITKNIRDMTQAELVQLRYNYVMEQTKLAQGDFAKTSTSWANQTRILSERFKELLGILGNNLVAILTPAINLLNKFMSVLIDGANKLSAIIGKIFGVTVAQTGSGLTSINSDLADIESTADDTSSAIDGIADSTDAAKKAAERAVLSFDELNQLGTPSTSSTSAGVNLDSTAFGNSALEIQNQTDSLVDGVQNKLEQFFATLFSKYGPKIMKIKEDIGSFQSVFEKLQTLIQTFFTVWVFPVLEKLQTVWTELWTDASAIWDEYGATTFENIRQAMNNVLTLYQKLFDKVIAPLLTEVGPMIDELWEEHLRPLFNELAQFVLKATNYAMMLYNNVIYPIVSWIVDYFGPAIQTALGRLVSFLTKMQSNWIDSFRGMIEAMSNVLDFIKNVFTGNWKAAWTNVVGIFSGLWKMLSNIAKGPINLIIGLINILLNGIQTAVNATVRAVNKLSFDVPDWVPGIGGSTFGFNLKSVSLPRIPYLATGAVIPANKPFLAMLGDQRNGTNIETPLSTMIEAFQTALATNGGGSDTINLNVVLDGEVVYNNVVKHNRINTRMTNTNALAF